MTKVTGPARPGGRVKPGAAVVVSATGERGVVVGAGRDKETGEEVVCVELPEATGDDRWAVYPPAALTPIG